MAQSTIVGDRVSGSGDGDAHGASPAGALQITSRPASLDTNRNAPLPCSLCGNDVGAEVWYGLVRTRRVPCCTGCWKGSGGEIARFTNGCRTPERQLWNVRCDKSIRCPGCDRLVRFNDTIGHRLWCSENCMKRHGRRQHRAPRACADCGETFSPKRGDSIYCKAACKQRAYRERKAAE